MRSKKEFSDRKHRSTKSLSSVWYWFCIQRTQTQERDKRYRGNQFIFTTTTTTTHYYYCSLLYIIKIKMDDNGKKAKAAEPDSFRTQHVAHRTYYNTVRKEFVPIVNQDNKLGKEEERIMPL